VLPQCVDPPRVSLERDRAGFSSPDAGDDDTCQRTLPNVEPEPLRALDCGADFRGHNWSVDPLDDEAPRSITARIDVNAHARRQLLQRVFVCAAFAFTIGFLAEPYGILGAASAGALAFALGASLAYLRYSAALRSPEADFDSLRDVAAESGGPTPEERLEAFESVRFLATRENERDSTPAPRS
jgi:hypothetical protein